MLLVQTPPSKVFFQEDGAGGRGVNAVEATTT